MTIEEFKSLKAGDPVIFNKNGNHYKIRDIHLKMKSPETGEWFDAVTYVPLYENDEKLFCREKNSFIEKFSVDSKNYCELRGCIYYYDGTAHCDNLGH